MGRDKNGLEKAATSAGYRSQNEIIFLSSDILNFQSMMASYSCDTGSSFGALNCRVLESGCNRLNIPSKTLHGI